MQPVILCVDDEPGILDNLKIGLQKTFDDVYLIETAQSGEEALTLAQELKDNHCEMPVIISDYIMPGMKGDILLGKIHEMLPETRTIMLTGQSSIEGISHAINAANLYRYLAKPWELEDFTLTVTEAINSYNKDKQLLQQHQQLLKAETELKNYNQILEQQVTERTRHLVIKEKELRLATEYAEQAKRKAEYANQQKTAFLAMMSHELRTPLNCILGYTQVLSRDSALNIDQKMTIEVIHESGDHLLTLINDILDISKIESGKMELARVTFNFSHFLSTISGLVKQSAEKKGLQLTMDFSSGQLPQNLYADKKRLRQVLLNLLTNAIKFTALGQVRLLVQCCQGKLQFAVHDTGPGIAEGDLGKVFLPFQQLKQHQHKMEGTGLGLSITKQLVTLMDGVLQVESQMGVGTVFHFSIPLHEERYAQDRYESITVLSPPLPEIEPITVVGPGKRQAQYLMSLVDVGDIQGLIRQIQEYETQTKELGDFSKQLCRIARTYKIKHIRSLIEPYV